MYIPYFLIAIVIIAAAMISNRAKEKMESEHREQINRLRQEASDNWSKNYESYCKQKEELTIQIVAATFDCSIKEAKIKHKILCHTYFETEFLCADSNSERRKIYNQAIKSSMEDSEFENYINRILLPIVNKNNFDLDVSKIKHWQREFYLRPDISLEEKLCQIDNYYKNHHINIATLMKCSKHIIPNEITDGDTLKAFSNEEIIEIAKDFNNHFDFNIEDYILETITYKDFCFDGCIKKNHKGLFSILTACIYFSEELDIYVDTYGLRLAVTELFYFFPYYHIENWKIVLHNHLREVCEFRDISFEEINK